MERKRFDVLGAAVSFVLSFASLAGMLFAVRAAEPSSPFGRALAVGAVLFVPALVGYIAVQAAGRLRTDLSVQMPAAISAGAAIALAASFLVGAAGQFAYSYRTSEIRETTKGHDSSDIVMMIDDSGSLVPYYATLRAVANAFVDGVSENSSMAAGLFARKIGDFTDMAVMDADGKREIKKMLADENRFAGGSDLDLALQTAYEAFAAQGPSKRPRAIVLLTDGRDLIESDIVSALKEEKIRLYSVRIKGSEGDGTSALLSAVKETGGSDIEIPKDFSLGEDDLDDFMKQFEEIAGTVTTRTERGFEDVLLVYDDADPEVPVVLIRFVVLFIVTLCVQYLYVRKMSVAAVLLDFLLTVAVCAVMTFAPAVSPAVGVLLSAAAAAAGVYTWYVMLTQEGGYDSPYRRFAQTYPAPPAVSAGNTAVPFGGVYSAGAPNAGYPNAGTPYASAPTGGTPYGTPPNRGAPNAGSPNAGTPYASVPTAGTPYGAPPNRGAPSAGSPNAGTPYASAPTAGTPYGTPPNRGAPSAGYPNAGTPYGAPWQGDRSP